MYTLTAEQKKTLIEMIGEEIEGDLTLPEFADALMSLFEDIPGFETIPPAKASDIVNQLWRTYHGQEPV